MSSLLSLRLLAFALALSLAVATPERLAIAQSPQDSADSDPGKPHSIHLILKDGSFQIVTSYKVSHNIVRYTSAERGGAIEEIPVELVDLEATARWEKQHTQRPSGAAGDEQNALGQPPAIDPEVLKEEEERMSLTPIVAPDLRLPEQEDVLALDTFQGSPELVPLVQSDGDLNRSTAHSMLKKALNPISAPHSIVQLKGTKSFVQLHVDTPIIYLRVGDDTNDPASGNAHTVDTHGAPDHEQKPDVNSATSRYVVVRADVRVDARLLMSFNAAQLGKGLAQNDVTETHTELMRGGHWLKITPAQPLEFGEYALLEVISPKEINTAVWDFGVHSAAPENRDVIHPDPRKAGLLGRPKPE